MKVYKGTDKDIRCKGLQYEIGDAVTVDGDVKLCERGLHACEMPLDVLNYYPPATSRYFEAWLEGVTDEKQDDTKRVGNRLTLKAELSIAGLVKAQIEYVKKRATPEDTEHATGYQGAASATGDQGAASATGKSCVALSTGVNGKVMGAIGNAIVCVERGEFDGNTYPIKTILSAVVDGGIIKPDVWYTVENGKWVEAK